MHVHTASVRVSIVDCNLVRPCSNQLLEER
jgi:hypothetical protein